VGGAHHANRLFCTRLYASTRLGLVLPAGHLDFSAMNRRDISDFRPRPGRIRDRGRASARRSPSFFAEVMRAAAKANGGQLPTSRTTGGRRRGDAPRKGKCSRVGRGPSRMGSSGRRFGRVGTCCNRHGILDEPGCGVLEGGIVKATYDTTTDTLSITLKADAPIAESDEDKPGVILDYDEKGNLVSLEILDFSKRVTEARRIEFETTG
jgi:uncharacterized protein YuzE